MKQQSKKKSQFQKATKAASAATTTQAGRYVVCAGKHAYSSEMVTFRPGSLLEPSAGVVPTVELSKRAAKKIS